MSGSGIDSLGSQNLSDIDLERRASKKQTTREWFKTPPQKYMGETLLGHIHGRGFYFVDREEKIFYDGLFYANKLEGYSQVFYNDGCDFQGLFKDNIRFGPGVYTYPNGQQDVGLWMGRSLVRLGSANDRNMVPRLATTPLGQLKLLKYRYLVPVCQKHVDEAYNTLKLLGANERVLQNAHKLYNMEIGNKSNVFFNKKFFDKQFFGDQDCSIDIAIYDEDSVTDSVIDNTSELQQDISTDLLDLNAKRRRQLQHQIQVMDHRLEGVKEKIAALEKNVDYCKSCCQVDETEKKSVHSIESTQQITNAVQDKYSDEDFLREIRRSVKIDDVVKIDTFSAYSGFSYYSGVDDDYTQYSSDEPSDSEDDLIADTDTSDVTAQIKDYLMDTCICDEMIGVHDLYQAEKQLNTLKKDEVFFECILKNLKEKMENHTKAHEELYQVKTKKISVKDVLAWNNEERCMRMLKHGFLHRNSEYMVKFDVSDLIAGNRREFGEPGTQERECLEFINACNDGDRETILKLVQENHVDVNVCDAKGNGGIFLAAVNREIDTIKLLVTLGAKIDAVNDEGLLPLSMCFLVYLAEKHNIFDWERSFLPDTVEPMIKQKDAYKWYQNMSLNLLAQHGRTTHSFIQEVKTKESEMSFLSADDDVEYFFKINCPVPKSEDLRKSVAYSPKVNISYTHRKSIEGSIRTLLHCGANPNAGEAPLPPLFLALFTENLSLVECVLDANADTNAMIEEDVTALHVVASLKCSQANADICSLLVEYDCDPRLKTTSNHWPEQKKFILGDNVNPDDVEDFGKNPLHILCLRRDFTDKCTFFQQMSMVLTDSRIDCNERYLGHTPLSLAVLVGNKCLVESLLHLNVIDPHQTLDTGMGNVLTIYILKRYHNQLPPNAKDILTVLVNSGVNPLRSVGEHENVIAFMDSQHVVEKKKKTQEPKNQSKRPESATGVSQEALRGCLRILTRNTIMKYIQLYAVHTLYNFIEDGVLHHRCMVILSELLTPDIIIKNLQYLFRYGKIHHDRFDKEICLKLIDTVNKHQVIIRCKPEPEEQKKNTKKQTDSEGAPKPKKNAKKTKKVKSETKVRYPSVYINTSDYSHILDMADFKKVDKARYKFKQLHPGLDNVAKYKVCFHCLKKQNKQLVLCPRCQLVYFCSEECNEAILKMHTIHVCDLNVFQLLENKNLKHDEKNNSELYAKLEENCENRRRQKRENEIEQAKLQFLEARKSDTYGTKWVRWKREQKMQVKRTPTNQTLLGSISNLARWESEMFSLDRKETNDSIARRTFSGSIKHAPMFKESQEHTPKTEVAVKKKVYPRKNSHKCVLKDCKDKRKMEKSVCKCKKGSKEVVKNIKIMEEVGSSKEPKLVVKKLRTIPTKYELFIGLLSKYFPGVDSSSLFLPYTCYSNGHLYYNFSNNELDKRTYSMM